MLGSNSIGSSPVGSRSSFVVAVLLDFPQMSYNSLDFQKSKVTTNLEESSVSTEGLSFAPYVRSKLPASEYEAVADNFVPLTKLQTPTPLSGIESLDFQKSYIRTDLSLSDTFTEALEYSQYVSMYGDLSEINTEGISIVPKTLLDSELSSLGAESLGKGMYIWLDSQMSEVDTTSKDLLPLTKLKNGISESEFFSLPTTTRITLHSHLSQSNWESLDKRTYTRFMADVSQASVEAIDFSLYISMYGGLSQTDTEGLSVTPKTTLVSELSEYDLEALNKKTYIRFLADVSQASVEAEEFSLYINLGSEVSEFDAKLNMASQYITNFVEGIDFSTNAIDVNRNAFSIVGRDLSLPQFEKQIFGFGRNAFGVVGRELNVSQYRLKVLDPHLKLFLGLEKSEFQATVEDIGINATGNLFITIDTSEMFTESLPFESGYIVTRIPDLISTNKTNAVELDSGNTDGTHVKYYKANGHIARFNLLEERLISDMKTLDNEVGIEPSYKYKASFSVKGNIGGQAVEVEGQKSKPRIVIRRNG